MRLFARVMLAMCLAVAAGFNAQAQTKPKVTTSDLTSPRPRCSSATASSTTTTACPGISPSWSARPMLTTRRRTATPGDDRRLRPRLARHGQSAAAGRHRQVFVRRRQQVVFNKPGRQFDAVDHDGLQPVPDPSAIEGRVHDIRKKDSEIVVAHGMRPVLFMSWAYNDKPEMTEQLGRGLHDRRQCQRCARDSRGPRLRARAQAAAGAQSVCAGQAASEPRRHVSGGLCDARRADRPLAGRQFLHDGHRSGDRGNCCRRRRGTRCRIITGVDLRDLVGWAKRLVGRS